MFPSGSTFRYNAEKRDWMAATIPNVLPSVSVKNLKVVTWNTLFDIYEADKIYTEYRTPLLLDILQKTNADIVGLQEIRPKVLAKILAQPWVQERYYVSEDASVSNETCERFGQIILCRWPFKLLCANILPPVFLFR
jgi:poly(A) polymerase